MTKHSVSETGARRAALRRLGTAAAMATALFVAAPAVAQWAGPSDAPAKSQPKYAATTIAAIKATPKDDQKVILEGKIVRKLGDERYLFADSSGQIEVEIDDEEFPKEKITENTRLRLEGEVDTHMTRDADIDVERVTILR